MNKVAVQRETHTIDATGQSFGRLASDIVKFLRGKHRPTWQPHIDSGDFVIVENVDKMAYTGNKMVDKMYYRHSQYPGGLKEQSLKETIAKKGHGYILEKAVYNMLPKTKHRKEMMKRLTVKETQA